jgi:hypothetical protein
MFTYMTNVTLDLLASAATSILFLAEHYLHLRCLTFTIKPTYGSQAGIMDVVQALRVLTVRCGKLEAVRLVLVGGKGVTVELGKADFGRVVLWAWENSAKVTKGEAVEGAVGI